MRARFFRYNLKGQNNILLGDSMCEKDACKLSQKLQFLWNLTFSSSFLFFYLFTIILFLCMCVYTVWVYAMCVQMSTEARTEFWIPWSYRWLWVILMWVLETKLGSSKRAGSVPNHRAISPGSFFCFQCQKHYTKVEAKIQYTPWLNEVKMADSIFRL